MTGWPKGRPLARATIKAVAQFIYKEIICRHGCVLIIITDRGPKNKAVARELIKRYKIQNIIISLYNPYANSQIKYGYKPFILALQKLTLSLGKA